MSTSKANETPKKPRKARNKVSKENQEVSENLQKGYENAGVRQEVAPEIVKSGVLTPELQEEIIDRLSDGEPLRQICRDEHMPNWATVYRLMDADVDFKQRIAHAREIGEEAISQDILAIADTPMEGIETEESENGIKTKRADMLGHRKLQIETRLKLLAKWNPKKYGDRIQHANDPDSPLIANLSEEDLGRRIAQLEFKIKGGK